MQIQSHLEFLISDGLAAGLLPLHLHFPFSAVWYQAFTTAVLIWETDTPSSWLTRKRDVLQNAGIGSLVWSAGLSYKHQPRDGTTVSTKFKLFVKDVRLSVGAGCFL